MITGSAVPPRIGLVVDKELVVVYVEKESPAEASGVHVGDKVQLLDKRELSTGMQAKRVFNRADASQKITLTILRDN